MFIELPYVIWFTLISLANLGVVASPQINYPLSQQSPPIARVGEEYEFQFASTTFQPDPDRLQYSLVGNPSWLSLDGKSRVLRGSPKITDVGEISFTIAAAEEGGGVANMESKLFVSDKDSPIINGNISQILAQAGELSGPQTLTLLPARPFDIKFPPEIFHDGGKDLSYRATLVDHTPLPTWLGFDATSLRFSGTTPTMDSPQSFEVILIASDIPIYSSASIPFTLVVSSHQLVFRPLEETLNITKGDPVGIFGLRTKVLLDGEQLKDEYLDSVSAKVPSWLLFNDKTFDLTGHPPIDVSSQEVEVTVNDKFGDTAKHTIYISFVPLLSLSEVFILNLTAGEQFEQHVPRSILTANHVNLEFYFGALNRDLTFDPLLFVVSGKIPKAIATQETEGVMTATSSDGKSKESQRFSIHIQSADVAATNSGQFQEDTSASRSGHGPRINKAAVIAGSVVAGTIMLLLLVAFVVWICQRKRYSKGYISPRSPWTPRKIDISRPILVPQDLEDDDKTADAKLEEGKECDLPIERNLERPPPLNLKPASKKKHSQSIAESIGEEDSKILTEFDRSSVGYKDEAGPSHRPHDSMKLPTAIARRVSELSNNSPKHVYHTTPNYRDSKRGLETPSHRRKKSYGHDRHTYTPSRSGINTAGLERTLSSDLIHIKSTYSTRLSPFPRPPASRHTTQFTSSSQNRRSIRIVTSSPRESYQDNRTIDQKRNSYIRKRASAQSPFFGASARVSSSSYKPPAAQVDDNPEASSVLSPVTAKLIVKPSDEIIEPIGKEIPESLRIQKLTENTSIRTRPSFPGSLRRPPSERSFLRRHPSANRDRVNKSPERKSFPRNSPRNSSRNSSISTVQRVSSRESTRGPDLRSRLNDLTAVQVYDDREMSKSAYSTEEDDIEEFEKRSTIRPTQFLPPLNFSPTRKPNKEGKMEVKPEKKRELKRTNERDPTPYTLASEHGGKENRLSTYSLSGPSFSTLRSGIPKPSHSPDRPKTTIGTSRLPRPARHSRTASRTVNRSDIPPKPHETASFWTEASHQERHSRKSLHSPSQSRHSGASRPTRSHSRTQSSSYPIFSASPSVPPVINDSDHPSTLDLSALSTLPVRLTRDLSGNLILEDADRDTANTRGLSPLDKNITQRARKRGPARYSRAHPLPLHSTPPPPLFTSTSTPASAGLGLGLGPGLGLSLADSPSSSALETPAPCAPRVSKSASSVPRTPLGTIRGGDSNSNDGGGGTSGTSPRASPSPIHSHTRIREGVVAGTPVVRGEGGEGVDKGLGRTCGSWRGSVWSRKSGKAFL
ncbi:hypothetical protein BS50DRAFT_637358 [Corynespora cassiicola Philippines]|uniref:Dystroglycan-type cadherin-like domain-containing protein n=1 Tax=Corynespora cassiicola Philippines TaxID=1448308 RepID=A0A2T2NFL7_CORCC|nr:hypothetical protein BS50DRAFT_637358 [Corynespora cassiicola Philippines]